MSNFIPISSVVITERQRKYFDEMKMLELIEAIQEHDLLHAPAVLEESFILVAGERRLRAMTELHRRGISFRYQDEIVPKDHIPVSLVSSRSEVDIKAAELAENLCRQDISWQERAAAERELHLLRSEQNPKQRLRDTAQELKKDEPSPADVSRLSENLLLAKHLDDPEIARTKDKRSALKKIQQKEVAKKRAELASHFQLQAIEAQSPHTVFLGDFHEVLPTLPPRSFDLLLTDPPYGVDAETFGSQFTIAHKYQDSSLTWEDLMADLAQLSYDLCKDEAFGYIFCDIRKFYKLLSIFDREGWSCWDRPLIWDKGSLGVLPKPDHGPRLCYEAILFVSKGEKKILKNGRDVLPFPNPQKLYHGAEKPVDLLVELIQRTTDPGGSVLDPFAGSGSIFPAATRAGCLATGVELEEEYYHICLQRRDE